MALGHEPSHQLAAQRSCLLATVCLVAVALAACSSTVIAPQPAPTTPGKAVVIGSGTGDPVTAWLSGPGVADVTFDWVPKSVKPGALEGVLFEGHFSTKLVRIATSVPKPLTISAGTYRLAAYKMQLGTANYSTGSLFKEAVQGKGPTSLAEFNVAPGEVVYIGHMVLATDAGDKPRGARVSYTLNVEDRSNEARVHLARTNPDDAARMIVRLATINPRIAKADTGWTPHVTVD
jgi:hypothetical protein